MVVEKRGDPKLANLPAISTEAGCQVDDEKPPLPERPSKTYTYVNAHTEGHEALP
jgi:hypothetical protein